MRNYDLMDIIT